MIRSKIKFNALLLCLFFFVWICLSSCSESPGLVVSVTNPSLTKQSTATKEVRTTPLAIINPTKTPGTPTVTATVVEVDSEEFVLDHEYGPNNCQFPCWWGVTIEDEWKESLKIFDPLKTGVYQERYESFKGWFLPHDHCQGMDVELDEFSVGVNFCSDDQKTISYIQAFYWLGLQGSDDYPNYRPIYYFNEYGAPDDIWLFYVSDEIPAYEYALVLFYEKEKFVVIFHGLVLSQSSDYITFCPNQIQDPNGTNFLYLMVGDVMIYDKIVTHLEEKIGNGFIRENEHNAREEFSLPELINSIRNSDDDSYQCLKLVTTP